MIDFLKIYDEEREALYNYVLGRVGNRDEAEDIISDVFLRAIKFEKGGGEVTHARGLIYRIAKNLIIDHYRQRGKETILVSIHDEEDGERPIDIPDTLPLITELIDKEIASVEIKSLLSRLREESREVIVLRYLQQLDIEEVAEALEKSEGAVRVQLHRAVAELREIFDKSSSILKDKDQ